MSNPNTSESPGHVERAQPESLRARSLSVSLTVDDLAASRAWYRDLLGFTLDQEHERDGVVRGVSMKAGDVRVLLNQDDGAKGSDRKKGQGFSLYLTTTQDVDAIARRVVDGGGTLASEPQDMPWGPRMFRVIDPDGFGWAIGSQG